MVPVEDDEDIQVVAEKALRGSGHEVFSAGDGESGLQPVKEKRPDLVIPDLMMPRMHGFTVCQAVRNNPSPRHIAILVTSAKSHPVEVARAHELGADNYPTKPYDIQVCRHTRRDRAGVTAPGKTGWSRPRKQTLRNLLYSTTTPAMTTPRWTGSYLLPEST